MEGSRGALPLSASSGKQFRLWAILALSGLGVAVSSYLSLVSLKAAPLFCVGGAGCGEVLASPYARVAGVPVALLGLGMYLALLALALGSLRFPSVRFHLLTGSFVLSLAGALFSLYLTGLSAVVISQFCNWCLLSAATVTAISALSLSLLLRTA